MRRRPAVLPVRLAHAGLLLASGLAVAAMSCSEGGPEDGLARRSDADTLVIALATPNALDHRGVDPALATHSEAADIGGLIFDRLVRFGPDRKTLGPGLAERWEVDGPGTSYTLHLRRDITFHDGSRFDAEAVVFSFTRARGALSGALLASLQKVEAVDPWTVRFTLSRPSATFLTSLASFQSSIVSPRAVRRLGKDFPRRPAGSGPYRLVEWVDGKRIELERVAGADPAISRSRRIIFRALPNPRERLDALESGAIHIGSGFRPKDLPLLALHPRLQVIRAPGEDVVYVALNTGRAPFDRREIRIAANRAINRKAIANLIYQGAAQPATGPVPPSIWGHRSDLRGVDYDPDLARDELVRAGGQPGRRLRFLAPRGQRQYLPEPVELARFIQQSLAHVGLETELSLLDYGDFVAAASKGEYDLAISGWIADIADPHNFLHTLLVSENSVGTGPSPAGSASSLYLPLNRAAFRDPAFDALVRRAEASADRTERLGAYGQAQEIFARELPWIPLVHTENVFVARRGLRGLDARLLSSQNHVHYGRISVAAER